MHARAHTWERQSKGLCFTLKHVTTSVALSPADPGGPEREVLLSGLLGTPQQHLLMLASVKAFVPTQEQKDSMPPVDLVCPDPT